MAFTEMQVGDQEIRHDRDRTQLVYSGIEKGDADECGCIYCRNFAAQRESAYPESFKRLLDQLGIDPAKEGEVYEAGPAEGGRFTYGGWFYFVGEMIEAGRSFLDVAHQLYAAERTVRDAKKTFINDHLDHCLDQVVDSTSPEACASVDEFKIIAKYL